MTDRKESSQAKWVASYGWPQEEQSLPRPRESRHMQRSARVPPHHPFMQIFWNVFNISPIEHTCHKTRKLTQTWRHHTSKWFVFFFPVKTPNILLQMILSKIPPARLGVPKGCSTFHQYLKLHCTATTEKAKNPLPSWTLCYTGSGRWIFMFVANLVYILQVPGLS